MLASLLVRACVCRLAQTITKIILPIIIVRSVRRSTDRFFGIRIHHERVLLLFAVSVRPQLPVLLHPVLRFLRRRHSPHDRLGCLRAHLHAPPRSQTDPHEDDQQVGIPAVDEAGQDDAGHLPRVRSPVGSLSRRSSRRPLRPIPASRPPVRVPVRAHARQRQLHHLRHRQQEDASSLSGLHHREASLSPLHRARRPRVRHCWYHRADPIGQRGRCLRRRNGIHAFRDSCF